MILHDIAQLIQNYMELPNGSVWLKNEKIMMPTNKSFAIVVGFMDLKPFGSCSRQVPTAEGMSEQVSVNMKGSVVIDIKGRDFEVINRAPEIVQAMKSTMCKEMQIKNGYMIAELPSSYNDLSELDGAAIPYRFQIVFAVQFISKKTKIGLDYYDNFRAEDIYEST